jgi:HTH-type transcriptional regulator/antitoxin HigA
MVVKNSATIDAAKYGRLCAKARPKVIANDEEFDRMVAQMEALSFKEDPTPEEDTLVELLAKLIEDYDSTHYPLPDLSPRDMVEFLMDQRGLKQSDLLPVFGSRGITSEVLSGKREPSKANIRKLAEFFGVSADLFL